MWELIGTIWRYQGSSWIHGAPMVMYDFDSTLRYFRGQGPDSALGAALIAALSGFGGRNVIIFSNRSTPEESGLREIKAFITTVEEAGGSCDVYAATTRDHNRKPQTGAWKTFLRDRNITLTPRVYGGTYFCGDAAGRIGDFSAADRNFARNIGVRYFVPEQIFGEGNVIQTKKALIRDPAPPLAEGPPPAGHALQNLDKELLKAADPQTHDTYMTVLTAASNYDMVILVGSPASGKSTFARALARLSGHEIVSQDVQKTMIRTRTMMLSHLKAGRKIIVDNTHRDFASRENYIAPVRTQRPEVTIVIVWLKTAEIVCKHLDGLRCDLDTTGTVGLLPRLVIPGYWANFEEPDHHRHGVQSIYHVPFAFAPDTPPEVFEKRYAP